jgi:hypothetical protein
MTMQAQGNVLPVRMRGDLTPNAVTVARAPPDAASWSVGPVHLFDDRARPGLTR